ncbi:SDR family oxidoreductase [Roseibium denhamense]|uniref:NAD(P)-dependent dehydrogenase, short-chain alcohol dehydrogenase family n=1 Tax=Roseibium denhamense TaxID=76305 RepID=A0ABY1PMY8_9HYPH|nr:SDR family oxidoreductase [Roseibium denhamense]MTI03947.1 SDR family oxidoreductase [Roseibium denhamense]SMP37522.1 NAD(P)-dependent dehydrogenase, short-chain alcohol dehydrogenase family [Roseibium denhamense]
MADQKIALVTGAGKRLGKAIAEGLAAEGYAVGLHYNSSVDGAKELHDRIQAEGGKSVLLQKDLSQPETAGTLISDAAEALGGAVSVLVNSASAFNTDCLSDLTLQSWQFLMNVNAAAPVFLMQAFAQQEPLPEGGLILNMLDTQMMSASPERFSYFCGKFALDGATRLAAYDLGAKGIRVNAIAPGLILPSDQTQENFDARQRLTPLGPGLGPEDIVGALRYFLTARQVTGHTLVVDAGQRLMGFGNAPIG